MNRPKLEPDLLATLLLIQKRPKMFIRTESLDLLEAYIGGFEMCERANGIGRRGDGQPSWSGFVEWLRVKNGVVDQRGWASIIRGGQEGADDKRLFEVLFEEIEQFFSEAAQL